MAQPPIIVDIEGVGELEFPDGTDDAVIQQTVQRVVSERQGAAPAPTGQRRGFIPDEEWAQLSTPEKIRGGLEFAGRALGGTFLGNAAVPMVDSPKTSLALMSLPVVGKHLPRAVEFGRRALGVSTQRGGQNMQAAIEAARDVPVQTQRVVPGITRARELQATGSRMPRVVTQLSGRINQAERGELSFREAQDFVSSLSRMSANEYRTLTPQMKRQVIAIRDAVRQSLTEAAEQMGRGAQYASGVREYARGARAAEIWEQSKKKLLPAIIHGTGMGAGGALVYKLLGDKGGGR